MKKSNHVTTFVLASLFIWTCSAPPPSTEVDKELKALFDKNERFQQVATKKIGTLEKNVATLKKNQAKLGKQIPVLVKQIKILKKAIDQSGGGVSPAMEAQLDSILTNLTAMEKELAQVKEMGPQNDMLPETVSAPPVLIKGSDQERIYRQYGDPIERYLVDNNQVWLYDNGVVVFDMNGRIVSKEFK
jgi:septal ring factor EnvC (AmiA/AmiB activator)